MSDQLPLFGQPPGVTGEPADADAAARAFAHDPAHHVVLEASAGTGKTSVLVTRYVNLLARGVDPSNILAITFTRKAAAEMRERVIRELRRRAEQSAFDRARWTAIRDRLADIQISTIDAFCLSLLREFPLEADLDPGFGMADETEVPRLVDRALDTSLAIFIGRAKREPDLALVLAQLGLTRTREGLAYLLQRRLVAWDVLDRFLARGPADLSAEAVCSRAVASLADMLGAARGGLERFLDEGPVRHPRYRLLAQDLRRLDDFRTASNAAVRGLMNRVAAHFLKADGTQRATDRSIHPYTTGDYPSAEAGKRHRQEALRLGERVEGIVRAYGRDLNAVLARGIRRMFAIALAQYRIALDERSLLDFSDVLQRAVDLLGRMDEFSQSRYRLEGRYHHVLVDEFQDTSRKQWELIALLVKAWGEGSGVAVQPSIFIVGDRKQSIYRFRDADVTVLQEAGAFIDALRPGSRARRSIARSFRAVPELLAIVNDVFTAIGRDARRMDDFRYDESDRFPLPPGGFGSPSPPGGFGPPPPLRGFGEAGETGGTDGQWTGGPGATAPVLGLVAGPDAETCAAAVAAEIARILRVETVRDKQTGLARRAAPGDIGILFRSRSSHREFEQALEAAGIPSYVYKGLGFFDADEIKDLTALMRFLANPSSDLRAAAFLRSRFVRLSDSALAHLAPGLAAALTDPAPCAATGGLEDGDRRALELARRFVPAWLARVDCMPPADLIEQLIPETAYAYELRGARRQQAWENVKKMRALIRRVQNRGYATLARIADHIDSLTAGDESNAVLEALDAVNLMTVHASKGLEFPVVFVVNLARGATGFPRPVRVSGEDVSVGPFVSDNDEDEKTREREETKRLLYVALTRARDRLYLGAVVKDGALALGRGSLAEVLPDSFRMLFVRAAVLAAGSVMEWTSASDRIYRFRVCGDRGDSVAAPRNGSERPVEPRHNFEPLCDQDAVERLTVTQTAGGAPSDAGHRLPREPDEPGFDDRLTGTLVHRLFQHAGEVTGAPSDVAIGGLAQRLLRPEERAAAVDAGLAVRRAVAVWLSMQRQPDVAALLRSGDRIYEVPFSLVTRGRPARVTRGTIDCLVRRTDGSIVILEFKTGGAAPWHQAQLDGYVQAARLMYPDAAVSGLLVYPT